MAISDQDCIAVRQWSFERMQTEPGNIVDSVQFITAADQLAAWVLSGNLPESTTFVGLPPATS